MERFIAGPDLKYQSQVNEKNLARDLNLKPTKASGAGKKEKGDYTTPDGAWMLECKSTDKKSISVLRSWMAKLAVEASKARKAYALILDFGEVRYYLISEADFEEYRRRLENG